MATSGLILKELLTPGRMFVAWQSEDKRDLNVLQIKSLTTPWVYVEIFHRISIYYSQGFRFNSNIGRNLMKAQKHYSSYDIKSLRIMIIIVFNLLPINLYQRYVIFYTKNLTCNESV